MKFYILAVFVLWITILSGKSLANVQTIDTPVSGISNVDSQLTVGTQSGTSYINAQTYNGVSNNITETNVGENTSLTYTPSSFTSNVDGIYNRGLASNSVSINSKDGSSAYFSESASDYSAYVSNGGYFLVGGGTADFRSTTGTIEMWFKVNSWSGSINRMWGQGDNFEGRFASSGVPSAYVLDFGVSNSVTGTKTDWNLGEWYYYAITWNENTHTIYSYWANEAVAPAIDGQNVTTWLDPISTAAFTENNIMASRGGNNPLNGWVDEFRYWNTDLSQTQLSNVYDKVLYGNETNLQDYYQFESSLTDLTGNNNLSLATGTMGYTSDVPSILKGQYLNQEIQFVTKYTTFEYNKLNIYATSLGAEALSLSYWNGSSWTVLASALTANSWNNFSVSLFSTTFTLKLETAYSTGDSVADSYQIDYAELHMYGRGLNQQYTDTNSNVDSSANVGTQSSFSSMGAYDSVYNTLTEQRASLDTNTIGTANNGMVLIGGTTTTSWGSTTGTISFWFKVYYSSSERIWGQNNLFEVVIRDQGSGTGRVELDFGTDNAVTYNVINYGKWYFMAITWSESSDYLRLYLGDETSAPTLANQNTAWTSTVSGLSNNGNSFLGSSSASSINGEGDDLRYYNTPRSLTSIQSDYNFELVGNEANLRAYYKFDGNLLDSGPLSDNSVEKSGSTLYYGTDVPSSYIQRYSTYDSEFAFSGGPYSSSVVTLAIRTGSFSTESLMVDAWNGYVWENIATSLTANAWNNITVTSYASQSTIAFRFRDADQADTGQNTWQIDAALLKFTNYQMDWEQYSSPVDTSREYFQLTIRANSADGENFGVQIWNTAAQDWTATLTPVITSSLQWYNYTLTNADTIGSTITWRYIGLTESLDSQQTTLFIDYAGIDAYDLPPVVTTQASDIMYNEGQGGNTLSWTATDAHPGTYIIEKDGALYNSSAVWTSSSPVVTKVDGLLKGSYNFTIIFQDVNGNSITDTANVTVLDGTAPVFSAIPSNLVYNETTTGHTLSWTATDSYSGTYLVYFDGVLDNTATSWTSGAPIIYNVDGFLKGTHTVTMVVYDASGNSVMNNATVTVYDGTKPTITHPVDNTAYIEGSSGNTIAWTATDSYSGTFTLYRNGSQIFVNGWTSGSPIIMGIDGLAKGVYNFTIVAYDQSSNSVSDTVYITVIDTTNPVINSIQPGTSIQYYEGITGNKITWDISDTNPYTFTLYRNGTALYTFGWSNELLNTSIDGRSIGYYNYTLLIRDTSGNTAQGTVILHVIDNTNPILNSPSDFSYTEGTSNHYVSWVATDTHPSTYIIKRNGTQIGSGSWSSGVQISQNIDGLVKNTYNFTITVTDSSGNTASDSIFVTVNDNTAPNITHPVDFSYNEGSTSNTISWNAVDLYPGTYLIYFDTVLNNIATPWTNSSAIVYNVDGFLKGIHNVTIVVTDVSGNSISDTVIVTVKDATNPVINPLSDTGYTEGGNGGVVTWFVSDTYPGTYRIFRDSAIVKTGSWTTNVAYNISGMVAGVHNVTLQVFDASLNSAVDQISVTVTDNLAPTISSPSDIQYNETTIGNTISWSANDLHPGGYQIYRDSELVSSGSWTNNIVINVDGLTLGSYTYLVNVTDASGNSVQDTVSVTVVDGTTPVTTHPSDLDYSEGLTGNTITWTVTDLHPANYTIYRDLTQVVKTGNWVSGNSITVNIDGLTVGDYNYTLLVQDTTGNTNSDLVKVKVTAQPIIQSSPGNYYYIEGATGNQLTWLVSDGNPDKYIIYRTNTSSTEETLQSGSWTSYNPISIGIDGLPIGVYNYTLFVNDTDGFIVTDQINVTVSDLPLFAAPYPGNITYEWGTTGHNMVWNATDMFPDVYYIYQDGVQVDTNTWTNASTVTHNVDGLGLGTYNFTIVFLDTVGNQIMNTTYVTVIDTTAPLFVTSTGDYSYNEGSIGNSLSWTFTDALPATYTIYRDVTNLVGSGTWTSGVAITLSNIDGLSLGTHTFNITVYDSSGNSYTDTITITVVDGTPPTINSPADITYSEGDATSHVITWTPYDLHPVGYHISNGTAIVADGVWNGGSIQYNVSSLLKGSYTYTLTVNDTGSNSISDAVTVNVYDTTDPFLSASSGDIVINEGTPNVDASWTFTDNYPDMYSIKLNNVLNVSLTSWTSGQPITYSLNGFPRGSYDFAITIYDVSGNTVVNHISVTINDVTNPDLTGPGNFTVNETDTGNTVSWTVGDIHPSIYNITRNGSLLDSGSWTNGSISVSLNGYVKGTYVFVINVYDDTGNDNTDTLTVTVQDATLPSFTGNPIDATIDEGTTGHSLQWVGSDLHPSSYGITRNGTLVLSGSWTSGNPINLNIDGLSKGVYTYIITLNDTSGNAFTNTVVITVDDTTNPVIVSTPTTPSYIEGQTGKTLTWTATDIHAAFYSITRANNSGTPAFLTDGVWTSGQPVAIDISGMTFGLYTYVITFNDTTGNIASNTYNVTVFDAFAPTVTDVVGPIDVNEGLITQTIPWTLDDINNYSYTVKLDGAFVSSANFSRGQNINFPIDTSLMLGSYNYTIYVYDLSGNVATDWVIVQVFDVTDPQVNNSGPVSYSEGSSAPTLTWTYTENHPSYYLVYGNGTLKYNGTNPASLTYDLQLEAALVRGTYNYTIVLYDTSGNYGSNTLWVSVIDNTPPVIYPASNSTYIEGTTGHSVSWLTDVELHPGVYYVFVNNSQSGTGTWISSGTIVFPTDGRTKGIYNVTIFIYDDSGNYARSTLWLTVTDQTPPSVTGFAKPQYFEGVSSYLIGWIGTDNYPAYYNISKGGSPLTSGTWLSGENITLDVGGQLLGYYTYNITFYDQSGNSVSFITTLHVGENTPPVLNSTPIDGTYVEGTTGHTLTWNASDSYPYVYSISRNGSVVVVDSAWISNQNITLNIDGLSAGTYIFVITIKDTSNNTVQDSVQFTIYDLKNPDVTNSGDFTYESGLPIVAARTLTWMPNDLHSGTYALYIDNIAQGANVPWSANVSVTYVIPTSLALGNHNYTIEFFDVYGNSNSSSIFVTVRDTTAPATEYNLPTTSLEDGQGYNFAWTFRDQNPNVYQIIINGANITSGTWASNGQFSYFFTPLALGTYNVTVIAYDTAGNFNLQTTIVTVADHFTPVFELQASNQTLKEGDSNVPLTWSMNDINQYSRSHPDRYYIYRNDQLVVNMTWVDHAPVSYNLASLVKGTYNFTIIITDGSGNMNSQQVFIEIRDLTTPVLVSTPTLTSYNETTSGNTLTWKVTDLYSDTYLLYRNQQQIDSGNWTSGANKIFNIDGLTAGTYNFTIVFYDASGNKVTNQLSLNVIDVTPPRIIEAPVFHTYLEKQVASIQWVVVDNHPNSYVMTRNGAEFRTRTWTNSTPVVVDLIIFAPNAGYYTFNVTFYDQSGLYVNDSVTIRIKDPNVTDTLIPQLDPHRSLFEGDQEIINSFWPTTSDRDVPNPIITGGVPNSRITLDLHSVDGFVATYNFTTDPYGNFTIKFDYTGLKPGDYTWQINYDGGDSYQSQKYQFDVTINPHSFVLEFDVPTTMRQGEVYIFGVTVYYNDTQSPSSLGLSELTGRGRTPVSGIEVTATIDYLSVNGESASFIKPVSTDIYGHAIFRLSGKETALISKITKISAIVQDDINNSATGDYPDINTITINPPLPTLVTRIVDWLMTYYVYLLGFLAIIVVFAIFLALLIRRRRDRIREINRGIRNATEELETIQGLKAIIIQTSDKLTLFEELVFETTLNTSLIGGMISAFSSFLNEITSDETMGFEMMEREGANITVHKGAESNFILISETKIPITVLNQVQKAQQRIEIDFKDYFSETSRGVRKLTKAQIYPIFDQSLFKLSLTELLSINERNISKILKLKTVSRALKKYAVSLYEFNKSKYVTNGGFYLEDLIQYLQDQGIVHSILSRIVILCWEFNVVTATVQEQERVEDDIDMFTDLDPYDFSDLEED